MLLGLVGLLGVLQARGLQSYRNPFSYLLLLYLLFVVLGGLNSRDDDVSALILGPESRMDGLLYQIGLVLMSLFIYRVLRENRRAWPLLLSGLVVVGVVETAVVVLQRLALDPVGPLTRGFMYEVPVGTIGHPGMVAGFMVVVLIGGMGLSLRTSGTAQRVLLGLALLTVALGLGITTNKASVYALFAVLVLWNLLRRERWLLGLSVALLAMVLSAQSLVPNRLDFDRSLTDPATGKTRLVIWELALKAAARSPLSPLIGSGPDGFRLALLRYIPPEDLMREYRLEYGWPPEATIREIQTLYQPGDPIRSKAFLVFLDNYKSDTGKQGLIYKVYLDKAHNLLLDRLVSYGLFAVLITVALYLWPVWRLIRKANVFEQSILVALLAAFLYYLFWFPVVQVEPIHMVFVAMAWAMLGKPAEEGKAELARA
ncbi:O-antigen ligase family protein [Meiothermus sp. PNK-Is4]|nr:O-antigen ligase family protein [Meiothermus sp. PNK-Is4]